MRRSVVAAFALVVVFYAVDVIAWRGNDLLDHVFDQGVQNVIGWAAAGACWLGSRRHAAAERTVWRLVAAALALWATANVLWTVVLTSAPDVSVVDALWLFGYVLLYAALVVSVRQRVAHFHASVWLDGVIGVLGMSALSAGLLWPALREAATGDHPLTIVVTLAYPVADVLMLALLAGVAALVRGRVGPALSLLAAGLAITAAGDVAYLLQVTAGATVDASLVDVAWTGALLLMGLAAWLPSISGDRALRLDGWRVLVLPAAFALLSLILLGCAVLGRLATVPGLLAIATLAAVTVRAAVTFRENLTLLDAHHQARTDDLTGLLNRRGFDLAADQALEAARGDGAHLAMLLLDLDGFKELNDTFGHHLGDELLRHVGARLTHALPSAALARLGGDEFAALLSTGPREQQALAAGRRMLDALEDAFEVDGTVTHVGGSVGIARYPQHAGDRAELLRGADIAMYRAKRQRTGAELYSARADHHSRDRVALTGELHRALERQELSLHFQPKCDLATGQVTGVEALARWQHPERGLLYPDAFIALAEQHGMMRRLTRRVIELALKQQCAWADAGITLPVAVNISPGNLLDARFHTDVAELVARWNPPTGALLLEITEDTVMLDPPRALDTLARLGELGIAFALDDFGTGYSSLGQLKRLPLTELKIDKSFVLDMIDSAEDATIVRSIVELARNLGLHVVAEGVETQAHWERLQRLGCHTAQGYFLTRPLPAEQLTGWLRQHQPRTLAAPAVTSPAAAATLDQAATSLDEVQAREQAASGARRLA